MVFVQKFQTFLHILLNEESRKKVSATTGSLMGLRLFAQLNQQHKNKLITPLIIQITVVPSGTRRVKQRIELINCKNYRTMHNYVPKHFSSKVWQYYRLSLLKHLKYTLVKDILVFCRTKICSRLLNKENQQVSWLFSLLYPLIVDISIRSRLMLNISNCLS